VDRSGRTIPDWNCLPAGIPEPPPISQGRDSRHLRYLAAGRGLRALFTHASERIFIASADSSAIIYGRLERWSGTPLLSPRARPGWQLNRGRPTAFCLRIHGHAVPADARGTMSSQAAGSGGPGLRFVLPLVFRSGFAVTTSSQLRSPRGRCRRGLSAGGGAA